MPAPPRATYRLQLRGGMDFARAADAGALSARLGVSHLYLSPPFTAAPGSTHGYDVVDPNRFDPELGGEEGFMLLRRALDEHGLGLILDIVPNHMGIGRANAWWWDVLRHGRASRYAHYFDIDFAADPDGKLVLPVLGAPCRRGAGAWRAAAGARGRASPCWPTSTSGFRSRRARSSTAGVPRAPGPASPTAWSTGARVRHAATTAASSTSTSSPACGSRIRRCSRPATG